MYNDLQQALQRAFIDDTTQASLHYRPQLVTNTATQQVLPTLLAELKNCQQFMFSVAFITESGLAMLKTLLYDLRAKGVSGKIITSTYLQFNQPKMFAELLKLQNVEIRVTDMAGFHAKGYIFKHEKYTSLIVGSSNLTANALKQNYEWNVKLTSLVHGELVKQFTTQFMAVWQGASVLTPGWVADYAQHYIAPSRSAQQVAETQQSYTAITPNKMQQNALQQIQNVRDLGQQRALVVSATGTGKTYLSAFDVKQFKPKRMLFIVHREQIVKNAQKAYQKVLGGQDSEYGVLSGNEKNVTAKYTFATIQTLAKDATLQQFARDHFDYILIDEVHKAGAATYQKVMAYFTPQFLLGMTATPERTDDFNVFALFDYNIAYEIRLQEALEEDMLCPFHYFGVTDYIDDNQFVSANTTVNELVIDERVTHIIEKMNYYGYAGDVLRGLMFCSRKEEAHLLSNKLNARGLRTIALTGDTKQASRQEAVAQLERGELDYILTVDIFNEGIDIPSLNQIIMLRQTQSSIIFIQQLGRGLRKFVDKDYVTVIDFIGNYKNNYLIPVALSGDKTLNRDTARKNTIETQYIKGISTINFEEIARKQIFESIKTASMTSLANLREAYYMLKNRLGHQPKLYDFITQYSVDPQVIIDEHKTYQAFLARLAPKDDTIQLAELTLAEQAIIQFLSVELLNGKRIHEVLLLRMLMQQQVVMKSAFHKKLAHEGYDNCEETLASMVRVLNLSFFKADERKKYGNKPLILTNDMQYQLAPIMQQFLMNSDFVEQVEDIIACALAKNTRYSKHGLTRNEKYSRKDVCRLLNWEKDQSSTIYGYRTSANTCPVFITYHKDDNLTASVHYDDKLLNKDILRWYTRPKKSLASKEVIEVLDDNTTVHIFIKKEGAKASGDFFYLGIAQPDANSATEALVNDKDGTEVSIVHMNMHFKEAVDDTIYHYLKEPIEI